MAGPGQARFYSSTFVQTSLAAGIGPSTTTFNVLVTTGAPGTPFIVSVDQNTASEELMLVTNVSGLQYTVTRAVGGTSAVTHANGASVVHVMYAQDLTDASAHIGAFDAVHGLSVNSLVVGTTDAQTLSNKTLTNPVINSPTINGPTTMTGATTMGSISSNAEIAGTDFNPSGLTGATLASRYVGAVTTSAPSSGSFLQGDFVVDRAGYFWVCTISGSPGTWVEMTSAVNVQTMTNKTLSTATLTGTTTTQGMVGTGFEYRATDFRCDGLTGATNSSRYAGAHSSGAPVTGTFSLGDFIVDQTGNMWVCTTAGSPGTWAPVGGGQGIPVAPTTTASTGTATAGGTVEVLDAVLGTYQWTAQAGRRYRVLLEGCYVSTSVANDLYVVRVRDSGSASAPTITSTVVASGAVTLPVTGGPGQSSVYVVGTFLAGATGTHTIQATIQRGGGTGVGTPLSNNGTSRQLYVEDIGNV